MSETISDEKLDEFMEEVKGDVTQEDSIDPTVSQHMEEMGFLWHRVQQKLQEDGICFQCKRKIDFDKKEAVQLLEANKVEKGVVAFVSLCTNCYNKLGVNQNAKKKKIKKA